MLQTFIQKRLSKKDKICIILIIMNKKATRNPNGFLYKYDEKDTQSFSFATPMFVRIPLRLRSLPRRTLLPSPAYAKKILNLFL